MASMNTPNPDIEAMAQRYYEQAAHASDTMERPPRKAVYGDVPCPACGGNMTLNEGRMVCTNCRRWVNLWGDRAPEYDEHEWCQA